MLLLVEMLLVEMLLVGMLAFWMDDLNVA